MTIHRLTAGSGYDYLTRQVARQDATEVGHSGLGAYYTAKGEAPGVWVGAGMAGIEGLKAGDEVTAEHMARLFGTGEHPLGEGPGRSLGHRFRVYGGRDDVTEFRMEVARRFEQYNSSLGLPADHPIPVEERGRIRTQVGQERFRTEYGRDPIDERELAGLIAKESRPRTTAVAGFDLTFSPVKSVSTLWAVADRPLALQIQAAHQAAVRDALTYLERHALFTRTGKDGVQQVDVRGLVATAFTHRDSRAGDPDLHTHVAVANKVQTLTDGRWLSVDSRLLHKATVSASEVYNTALEKHLQPLGLAFAPRPAGSGDDVRRRPVREIVGVDPRLNQGWSTRRADIQGRHRELARAFQAQHGRPPTPVESVQLAQQATLETREAKHEPRSEAQQRQAWRAEGLQVLGTDRKLHAMVTTALAGTRTHGAGTKVDQAWVEDTADRILRTVQTSRSAWQVWHVRAESQRQVRDADVTVQRTEDLVQRLTDAVLSRSVELGGAHEDRIVEPAVLRRADGSSVYTVAGSQWFTSGAVLDAELRLVEAAGRDDGRRACAADVELALLESVANGAQLNAGQVALVREMATSGRRVQLAIAPAGSGKTTAMRALTKAWEASGGTVVGLAPSAAAAGQLREQTDTTTDTLAQLVFRLNQVGLDGLAWAETVGPQTLVLIDEAGMADTLSLDTAITWLLAKGASVRLIGDDQQLAAVGAGGVLRDIRATHGALHLSELMRFTRTAEGGASLELREGKPSALGFYLDAGRVHVGALSSMTEEVFGAWSTDRAAGRDAIMLAPTRELVSQLNQRARQQRLQAAPGPGRQVHLADGNLASVGDVVISRSNNRRLRLTRSDFVKNGDRWTVLKVGRDGRLHVRHNQHARKATLPAEYVQEFVELGYASTVHTAQGVSVDVTHALATGSESRQELYTMLTRGRHANHLYLQVVGDGEEHDLTKPTTVHPRTATDLLEAILARDDAPASATTLLREADDPAFLLGQATARYVDALYTAAATVLGPDALARLDDAAERLLPGLPQAPAWPTLRANLTLLAAAGEHPLYVLRGAATGRELDTAADPAAVIDWRLDDAGLRNTAPGPLPWLPGVPHSLAADPTWGTYLTARAHRVTGLAYEVARRANASPTPAWAAQGRARPTDQILADVAVWRAANQVEPTDLRPTGAPQPAKAAATYQAILRRQIQGDRSPALAEWAPLLEHLAPAARHDPFTPVLAERLAAASRAGINAATLVRDAAGSRPLPDDHAAAALWWRLAEHLSPAVDHAGDTDHLLTTQWIPALERTLGLERTDAIQASPWWPALVTTVERALQRGWNLDALTGTAPSRDADVDDTQAMVWRISILLDPPPDPEQPHPDNTTPPPDLDDVLPHPADLPSNVATDAEWRAHTPQADQSHDPHSPLPTDPVAATARPFTTAEVDTFLLLAAGARGAAPPLQPTEAELAHAYERETAAREAATSLTRLAQVNAMALAFYEQHLAEHGGWPRAYLTDRFTRDITGHPHVRPGQAPAGWTHLVQHLRRCGVTDVELTETGLGTTTRDGRLIDRFRDRVVFPITDHDSGRVLGFVGRRNPTLAEDMPHAGPKYLNTPTTALFAKSDQLYGAVPDLIATGSRPVLVEGPMDAHAVTLASGGAYVGVASLGTALTEAQAAQLATWSTAPLVATDADLPGRIAAERAFWLLAQHGLTPLVATLPPDSDPADLLELRGPQALTTALGNIRFLADVLLEERLDHLPQAQALVGVSTVLAAHSPTLWDTGIATVAERLGIPPGQVRRTLAQAVSDWDQDPRKVVAEQLGTIRETHARIGSLDSAPGHLPPPVRSIEPHPRLNVAAASPTPAREAAPPGGHGVTAI